MRAQENFDISAQKLGHVPALVKALAQIKQAAAAANYEMGVLPSDVAAAIIDACTEIALGKHDNQFLVDLMEGSGGTSINMNMNEVLANRALQILDEQPGSYSRIHPNDYVNNGQSTNDVVPTAVNLAIHAASSDLLHALDHLAASLEDRAACFDDVLRMGRTCLQAAQPMRLGQAFDGYASAIRRLHTKLALVRDDMQVLPLGGTAIGTGLGSASGYGAAVYRHLRAITGADVRPAGNSFDAMQNADSFSRFLSELRVCVEVVAKIAADLVLLSSDPKSGIGELKLPPVQPGSPLDHSRPANCAPRREILRECYSIAVGCHMTPNVGIECDAGLSVARLARCRASR